MVIVVEYKGHFHEKLNWQFDDFQENVKIKLSSSWQQVISFDT